MGQKPQALHSFSGREWNAQARRGWIILFLWQGSRFTNSDVARLVVITRRGAEAMMKNLSVDFPITQDDLGRWYWLTKEDA